MRHWAVARTKNQGESWAGANLERQGFECYMPRVLETSRTVVSGKSCIVAVGKPLFPNILFVAVVNPWRSILSTFGVAGIIMVGEAPALVRQIEIDELRGREDDNGMIQLAPALKCGDSVRVKDGGLKNQFGIYDGLVGSERVRILIECLGRKTSFLVPRAIVEAA